MSIADTISAIEAEADAWRTICAALWTFIILVDCAGVVPR